MSVRILAYEYLSTGALAGQPGAASLAAEGLAMLSAVLQDAADGRQAVAGGAFDEGRRAHAGDAALTGWGGAVELPVPAQAAVRGRVAGDLHGPPAEWCRHVAGPGDQGRLDRRADRSGDRAG